MVTPDSYSNQSCIWCEKSCIYSELDSHGRCKECAYYSFTEDGKAEMEYDKGLAAEVLTYLGYCGNE